jgi:septum site-determining protein MinC
MARDRVVIKGTSDGLIITIGAGDWSTLLGELDQHLGQKASFFKGGRVALRVGPRQLSRSEIEAIGQLLNRHQVSLWAVEGDSPLTLEAVGQLGLETSLVERPAAGPAANQLALPEREALLVQRTLRSGQVLAHPGHVVLIGDVNPGAEIRAGGNVIIWGRLRGTVHAGVGEAGLGEQAIVCALHFAPSLLRIGSHLTRSPNPDGNIDFVPEMASVQAGQIVAEHWK